MTAARAIGLGLMFLLAAEAQAQPQPPQHIIVQPGWRTQPSADELAAAYPDEALPSGLNGKVTITCRVRITGKLSDCKVLKEEPSGHGFARAALILAQNFDLSPMTVDGKPTDTGVITIPVSFQAPAKFYYEADAIPGGRPWYVCPEHKDQRQRFYPEKAQRLAIEGAAIIQCRLRVDGRPSQCAWLAESPTNLGFGQAGQEVACLMKFRSAPLSPSGELPYLSFPLRFRLPR